MNTTFYACLLASSEAISQGLFNPEQPMENKLASHFALVSEEQILSMNEEVNVPKKHKTQKWQQSLVLHYLIVSYMYLISPSTLVF